MSRAVDADELVKEGTPRTDRRRTRTYLDDDAGTFLYPFVGAHEPRVQDLLLAARRHARAILRALDPARGAVLHATDGAVVRLEARDAAGASAHGPGGTCGLGGCGRGDRSRGRRNCSNSGRAVATNCKAVR